MFALIFILSSRHVSDVKAYISNTYGKDGLDLFHLLLDTKRKFEKCKLDLAFLERCKVYNVFPKFLRFKLYKRALQHTSFYRSWQAKLLNREMQEKRKNVETLDKKLVDVNCSHSALFSVLDQVLIREFLNGEY